MLLFIAVACAAYSANDELGAACLRTNAIADGRNGGMGNARSNAQAAPSNTSHGNGLSSSYTHICLFDFIHHALPAIFPFFGSAAFTSPTVIMASQ